MTPDERFDRIDANIERLAEQVARLTHFVLDFREESARHFEIIDNRLNVIAANINNIEARFPTITTAILDFGKHATQLNNDHVRNRNAIAELVARMDGLQARLTKLDPAA